MSFQAHKLENKNTQERFQHRHADFFVFRHLIKWIYNAYSPPVVRVAMGTKRSSRVLVYEGCSKIRWPFSVYSLFHTHIQNVVYFETENSYTHVL